MAAGIVAGWLMCRRHCGRLACSRLPQMVDWREEAAPLLWRRGGKMTPLTRGGGREDAASLLWCRGGKMTPLTKGGGAGRCRLSAVVQWREDDAPHKGWRGGKKKMGIGCVFFPPRWEEEEAGELHPSCMKLSHLEVACHQCRAGMDVRVPTQVSETTVGGRLCIYTRQALQAVRYIRTVQSAGCRCGVGICAGS